MSPVPRAAGSGLTSHHMAAAAAAEALSTGTARPWPAELLGPPVYVSSAAASSAGVPVNAAAAISLPPHESRPAYRIILQPSYTIEEVLQANGRFSCGQCDRPIHGRIYFYPKKQLTTGEFVCDPVPFCRPECALAAVNESPQRFDLLAVFALMYGVAVLAAPHRRLLKVKGGLTLEAYHAAIDARRMYTEDSDVVVQLLAPLYITCCLMDPATHQPVPSALRLLEEIRLDQKTHLGPQRLRDNLAFPLSTVHALPPKMLDQTSVSQTFPVDPRSWDAPRPTDHAAAASAAADMVE